MRGRTIRVLVVDDSALFRRLVTRALTADASLEVVGEAPDGEQAVAMAARLAPDVITMDVEMPVMNGIEAVRRIMQARPRPVLMISALTRQGAEATFAALEAGACDFLTKRSDDAVGSVQDFARELVARVKSVAGQRAGRPMHARAARRVAPVLERARSASSPIECIVIGASTGGPPVVADILGALPTAFRLPIVVAQHMPGTFTSCFAERLDRQSALTVKLAEDGEPLSHGTAYICPGGMQTELDCAAGKVVQLRVGPGLPGTRHQPSVNVTFGSAARVFGPRVLAIVLTGMGDDGCLGGRDLKAAGAPVWAQDEGSSVVFGMPRAIIEAGLADSVLPSSAIAPRLLEAV